LGDLESAHNLAHDMLGFPCVKQKPYSLFDRLGELIHVTRDDAARHKTEFFAEPNFYNTIRDGMTPAETSEISRRLYDRSTSRPDYPGLCLSTDNQIIQDERLLYQ
jgi:hypothetical protein